VPGAAAAAGLGRRRRRQRLWTGLWRGLWTRLRRRRRWPMASAFRHLELEAMGLHPMQGRIR
jgi:hypothetical protein